MKVELESLDGKEIQPGVWIIGAPVPIRSTAKMRALARVGEALCVVELSIKFKTGLREEDFGNAQQT